MQIVKVSFGKTIPTGNFANERIDMEATVSPDETPEQVLQQLRERVDNFHRQNNPGLYVERTDYVPDTNVGDIPQPTDNQQQTPDTRPLIDRYISEIKQYTDIDKLKLEWNLLAKSNPRLTEAYENKIQELNNQ